VKKCIKMGYKFNLYILLLSYENITNIDLSDVVINKME